VSHACAYGRRQSGFGRWDRWVRGWRRAVSRGRLVERRRRRRRGVGGERLRRRRRRRSAVRSRYGRGLACRRGGQQGGSGDRSYRPHLVRVEPRATQSGRRRLENRRPYGRAGKHHSTERAGAFLDADVARTAEARSESGAHRPRLPQSQRPSQSFSRGPARTSRRSRRRSRAGSPASCSSRRGHTGRWTRSGARPTRG
jgi:hypothetical protein